MLGSSFSTKIRRPPFETFGGYVLLDEIGQGGMGVVYSGRQVSPDRPVALKILHSGLLGSEEAVRRFKTEGEALARLNHPNILPVFEVGEFQSHYFISTKLVIEGSLEDALRSEAWPASGNLSMREDVLRWTKKTSSLIATIARAVHFAHQHGILHRDLKPSNVLLDGDGAPVLADFGLAKVTGDSSAVTHSISVLGSPGYMAPEQARGASKEITTATDIYGLGAILYRLLSGHAPYEGSDTLEILRKMSLIEPKALLKICPLLPRDITAICHKALHQDSKERYCSALAMAEDLESFVCGRPVEARPMSTVERATRWISRNPLPATLLGLLFTAVVTGVWLGVVAVSRVRTERNAAQQNAARANEKEQESIYRLGDQCVQTGWQQFDSGNQVGALPWFLEAWKVQQKTPHSALMLSARVGGVLRTVTQLDQMWFAGERISIGVLSHDGNIVACGCESGVVSVRSLSRRAPMIPDIHLNQEVRVVVFSPDDKRLLIAGGMHGSECVAHVWQLDHNRPERWSLPHQDNIRSACFSPNGAWIATGSDDGGIRVWDSKSGSPVTANLKHDLAVTCVEFSPDSRFLATASFDGNVHVWQLPRGSEAFDPLVHPEGVRSVAFSPDGRRLVTACQDGRARVWDLKTGQQEGTPLVHCKEGEIRIVRFSPDGSHFVTSGEDGVLQFWSAESRVRSNIRIQHEGRISGFSFDSSGARIVSGSYDLTAKVLDCGNGQFVVPSMYHNQQLAGVAIDPSGEHAMTFSRGGLARVWKLPSKDSTVGVANDFVSPLPARKLYFEPKRSLLLLVPRGREVFLFRTPEGLTNPFLINHSRSLEDAIFSPDGNTVLSWGGDKFITKTDIRAWPPTSVVQTLPEVVVKVAFLDAKSRLAFVDTRARLTFMDLETGASLRESITLDRPVRSLSVSPDFRWLASSGGNPPTFGQKPGRTFLIDLARSNSHPVTLAHEQSVQNLCFSPNSRLLATATDTGAISVWDVEHSVKLRSWKANRGEVLSLEFRADSKQLLTSGYQGVLQVWDVETGEPQVSGTSISGMAQASYVMNGALALVWGDKHEARIVDVQSGRPVSIPIRHRGSITRALVTPDGRYLFTAGKDSHLRMTELPFAPEDPKTIEIKVQLMSGLGFDETGRLQIISDQSLLELWEKNQGLFRGP